MSKKKINSKGRAANEQYFVTTNAIQLRTPANHPKLKEANICQTIRSYTSSNPNEITYECYDCVELISSAPKFGIWYFAQHLRTRTLGWIAVEAIEYVNGLPEGSVVNPTDSSDLYMTQGCSKCKLYSVAD